MSAIYCFSGPCGCGKSTLASAFARQLAQKSGAVYLIRGDDFHAGFVGDVTPWQEILRFNWECILTVAGKALARGMDVVLDYVVEDELPLVRQLAAEYGAALYCVVLTASPEAIRQRLAERGDAALTDRALFLREKLNALPENQGRLLDNTGMTVAQELAQLDMERFRVPVLPLVTTCIDKSPGHGVS